MKQDFKIESVKRITPQDIYNEGKIIADLLKKYKAVCKDEESTKEDCIRESKALVRGYMKLVKLQTTLNNQMIQELNQIEDARQGKQPLIN